MDKEIEGIFVDWKTERRMIAPHEHTIQFIKHNMDSRKWRLDDEESMNILPSDIVEAERILYDRIRIRDGHKTYDYFVNRDIRDHFRPVFDGMVAVTTEKLQNSLDLANKKLEIEKANWLNQFNENQDLRLIIERYEEEIEYLNLSWYGKLKLKIKDWLQSKADNI